MAAYVAQNKKKAFVKKTANAESDDEYNNVDKVDSHDDDFKAVSEGKDEENGISETGRDDDNFQHIPKN